MRRDRPTLDAGLDWATEKINETVALLRRRDGGADSPDAFEASEYLVDDLTAKSDPVPDELWLLAVKVASPGEALHVGYAAYHTGREALEEGAWRRGAETGEAEAMNNLGVLLEQRGAIIEAECWYRRGAEAGCSTAMDNLGWLLEGRGEIAEAETWHRRAADARNARRSNDLEGALKERAESCDPQHFLSMTRICRRSARDEQCAGAVRSRLDR